MIRFFVTRALARFAQLGSAWRIMLARGTGTRIASGCVLAAGTDVRLGLGSARTGAIEIGGRCEFSQHVVLHPYGGTIRLGRNVYLGQQVVIFGHGGVDVGENSLIAMHCRILSSNHTVPPIGTDIRSQPDVLLPTRIGRDVWLGAGVTVLGGITIGDGCVVGAGAVVTHDLPAYSIALGVPAQVTGQRPATTRRSS